METRNAFQLIDRSARMPQSSATHLCNFAAAGSYHRCQCQTCLISDTACAVFIYFYARNTGQIQHITGMCHGKSHLQRFFLCHALKINCHHHGRHLVIRNISLCIAFYHISDLFR